MEPGIVKAINNQQDSSTSVIDLKHCNVNGAQWMLLLLRLAVVTTDDRIELRHSQYSTTYLVMVN